MEGNRNNLRAAAVAAVVAGIILIPMLWGVIGGLASLPRFSGNGETVPRNPFVVSQAEAWSTYANSEHGFSVSIPPELTVSDAPFSGFHTTFVIKLFQELGVPEELSPRIQVFASELPVQELLATSEEGRNEEQFPAFQRLEDLNYEAYQTSALDPEVIFVHTILGNDRRSFIIELFTIEKENDELKRVYNEMVKSFKILQ